MPNLRPQHAVLSSDALQVVNSPSIWPAVHHRFRKGAQRRQFLLDLLACSMRRLPPCSESWNAMYAPHPKWILLQQTRHSISMIDTTAGAVSPRRTGRGLSFFSHDFPLARIFSEAKCSMIPLFVFGIMASRLSHTKAQASRFQSWRSISASALLIVSSHKPLFAPLRRRTPFQRHALLCIGRRPCGFWQAGRRWWRSRLRRSISAMLLAQGFGRFQFCEDEQDAASRSSAISSAVRLLISAPSLLSGTAIPLCVGLAHQFAHFLR